MNLTPAQIKNLMRRGLRQLIDPDLKKEDKQEVKKYFNNECAYCGTQLWDGEGDIDHLVPASQGGANGLSNRVLSCKPCNAEKKRDRNWQEYLKAECATEQVYIERSTKIAAWVRVNGGRPQLSPKMLGILKQEAERVTAEYDVACKTIHKQLRGDTHSS